MPTTGTQPTPVLFRMDRAGEETHPTAVFPTLPGSTWDRSMLTCYTHVGQHSSCSFDWYRITTRPAKPEEYADLKAELERQGYKLQVCQRMTKAHTRQFMESWGRQPAGRR